jgi:AcrR family transcriptional regulator
LSIEGAMTRVVKKFDERYTEFLDTAQSLFFTKGYEVTSVQQIINAMNISKGAFYHYFASKTDLLEAVVFRLSENMLSQLETIISDTDINEIEKLHLFFAKIENWKLDNKEVLLETGRVMLMDANALLRSKMQERGQQVFVPLLAQIIEFGSDNNIFTVDYPLATAQMILKMTEAISQSALPKLLTSDMTAADIEAIKQQIIVFNQSVELILGLGKGTLKLIEPDALNIWLD